MTMNHSNSNNMNTHNIMPRRRLGNEYHRDISDEGDMPVILPGDDKSKNEDSNNDHMHDHNNNMDHDSMDHSTHNHNNSNMNHDMSNMNMNGGTTMYMDGFHSALFPPSSSPPPPCLNLLHPSWTLDTQSKFIFAMFFLTLMGMLVEACGVWRVKCLRKGRNIRREMALKRYQAWQQHLQSQNAIQDSQIEFRRQSQQNGGLHRGVSDISDVSERVLGGGLPNETTATTSTNSILCPAIIRRAWRKVPTSIQNMCSRICCCGLIFDPTKAAKRCDVAAATLHAARAWLGYILMLAVMSYAVEFLICAVLGMVLGRYWFVDGDGSSGGGGVMNGAVGVGGGIGGMGLGDAGGRQNSGQGLHMNMTDLQNDAMWGGGDPCCGIDDDEDDNTHNQSGDDLRKPLLSSLLGSNTGVTRRSGGQQTDIP